MTLLFSLLSPVLAADLALPAASPHAMVSQDVGTVTVSVDYSSPGVKERTVFGELVPYGKLWRTGANGATALTVSGPVTIGGTSVEAGTYSVFTEPAADSWTVILNRNAQASTGSYDKALDAARFTAKPMPIDARERLTFLFEDTDEDSTSLVLQWADVSVAMPIEVDTAGRAKSDIDGFVSSTARDLANAGRFAHEHADNPRALELLDASLAVEETWFATWIKANVQSAMGDKKSAYKTLKTAKMLGERDGGFFYADRVEAALKDWPRK